jgi:hypothetical protein
MMGLQRSGVEMVMARAGTARLVAVILAGLALCPFASAEPVDPQHPHDPPLPGDWGVHGVWTMERMYWLIGDEWGVARTKQIKILTTNPYLDESHCINSSGAVVAHWHFLKDYGSLNAPTVAQADAYYDWFYAGYKQRIGRKEGSNATNVTNGVCHAYHQYSEPATVANYWVDPPDSDPYTRELAVVHPMGANKLEATEPADRCHNPLHVWIILDDPWREHEAAYRIEWKHSSSAVYQWFHEPECNNDCPYQWGSFHTQYVIYRRQD